MTILKETEACPKASEIWKKGKGKIIIIFWEDKRTYLKKELKTSKALTSNMFVIIMFTSSIKVGF